MMTSTNKTKFVQATNNRSIDRPDLKLTVGCCKAIHQSGVRTLYWLRGSEFEVEITTPLFPGFFTYNKRLTRPPKVL